MNKSTKITDMIDILGIYQEDIRQIEFEQKILQQRKNNLLEKMEKLTKIIREVYEK